MKETNTESVTKKANFKLIFMVIPVLFIVAGVYFGYPVAKNYIYLSKSQIKTLGRKSAGEYFPGEINGTDLSNLEKGSPYKVRPVPMETMMPLDQEENETRAQLSAAYTGGYNLDKLDRSIVVVVYKYETNSEAEDAVEIFGEILDDPTDGFTKQRLCVSGATVWFISREVDDDKQTEESSNRVVIVFDDIPLSLDLTFGGSYDLGDTQDIIKEYLNLVTDDKTKYPTDDEIMTMEVYREQLVDDFIGNFRDTAEGFREDFDNEDLDSPDDDDASDTDDENEDNDFEDGFDKFNEGFDKFKEEHGL